MRKYSLKRQRRHPAVLPKQQTALPLWTLDQGYWPDGLYTPPTDEALQWDIQLIKNAGFNMLRKHISGTCPLLLPLRSGRVDHWQDMVSGGSAQTDLVLFYQLSQKADDRFLAAGTQGW